MMEKKVYLVECNNESTGSFRKVILAYSEDDAERKLYWDEEEKGCSCYSYITKIEELDGFIS